LELSPALALETLKLGTFPGLGTSPLGTFPTWNFPHLELPHLELSPLGTWNFSLGTSNSAP
jgi:hypothetical protein